MTKLFKDYRWLIGMISFLLWAFSFSAFATSETVAPRVHLETLIQNGTIPDWRSSGVFVRVGNKIYLWGGYKQCFADEPACVQDFSTVLSTYNLLTKTWSSVTTAGGPPPGRTYHSMAVRKDASNVSHIIVYGGLNFQPDFSTFISYADMWDFNTATNTWTQISAAATPGKRFGASFQIVGQKGYLFAGVEDLGGFSFAERNDVWEYNFTTATWTQLIANNPVENPVTQPGSRYRANFDYSSELNSIVLFGGDRLVFPGQPDKPHRRDTWLLHLSPTVSWEKRSEDVDPVVDSASAVLGKKHVVAFGDLEPQDNSMRCCNKPEVQGDNTRYCDDPVKNIYRNKEVNQLSHYKKYTKVTGTTALKRAAYVRVGDRLLVWGGYDLHCSKPGGDDGILDKNTTLRALDLSDLTRQKQ